MRNQMRSLALMFLVSLFAVSCRTSSAGPLVTMTSRSAGVAGELELINHSTHIVGVEVDGGWRVIHPGGHTKYTGLSALASFKLFIQDAGHFKTQIVSSVDASHSGLVYDIR